MKIDLEAYQQAANEGSLVHDWTHCMMAVAVGADSIEGCVTEGWPQWLAGYGVHYFDRYKDERDVERGERFLKAVKVVNGTGDWNRIFRDWRLNSILPIALEAIGEGDEPWRVKCREVVQWSIDNDGAPAAGAARAARAAWAADAVDAVWVVWAVWAAGAANVAGAAWAAEAAGAAEAEEDGEAARDSIEESFFRTLDAALQEGEK